MLTPQQNRDPSLACAAVDRIDGFDFALLGLRANEARTSIIRRAASRTARRIRVEVADSDEGSTMRSHLAVSTYRLLDPRRRTRAYERIQLSVFSEDDMEAQRRSRRPISVSGSCLDRSDGGKRGSMSTDLVA